MTRIALWTTTELLDAKTNRDTSASRVLGGILGAAIGLLMARAIEAGLFWADSRDVRVEFLHSFLLIALPYLGLVLGASNGHWLEPARFR